MKGGFNIKDYFKLIINILNIILVIGLYIFLYYSFYYNVANEPEEIINTYTPKEKETISSLISVEIKGEVESPGVYAMLDTNNINDLVIKAGGLKENAYTNNVNLARKLKDQMVVYIYSKDDFEKSADPKIIYLEKDCTCSTFDMSMCLENGATEINDGPDTYTNEGESKININTASIDNLMTLSGIGESKAKAIISYRELNGNFTSIEEIINVSGISENIYEKIKDQITI